MAKAVESPVGQPGSVNDTTELTTQMVGGNGRTVVFGVASISGSGCVSPQATNSNINAAGRRNDIVSLGLISIPPSCT